MNMNLPTPLIYDDGQESWRSRWLVTKSWNRLHRIAEGKWDENDWCVPNGKTVCGYKGRLIMPGIFSRMGLKRCDHCCDRLKIPRGDGAPMNVFKGQEKDA